MASPRSLKLDEDSLAGYRIVPGFLRQLRGAYAGHNRTRQDSRSRACHRSTGSGKTKVSTGSQRGALSQNYVKNMNKANEPAHVSEREQLGMALDITLTANGVGSVLSFYDWRL